MPSFIFSTLSFVALNLKTTRVSSSPSSRKNFKTALFIVFFHPSAGGLIAFFCKPLENGNVAANAHPCSSAKGLHRYLFPYRFFQQCSLCKRISLYCFDVCSKLDTSFALRYFALISHKTSFGKRESASVLSSSSSSFSSLVVVVVVVAYALSCDDGVDDVVASVNDGVDVVFAAAGLLPLLKPPFFRVCLLPLNSPSKRAHFFFVSLNACSTSSCVFRLSNKASFNLPTSSSKPVTFSSFSFVSVSFESSRPRSLSASAFASRSLAFARLISPSHSTLSSSIDAIALCVSSAFVSNFCFSSSTFVRMVRVSDSFCARQVFS
mmetsp:Transcript_3362/g.11404  ORF Transcript_3362/g.11404 Transcript_3362/m.11404 type:complete len:322 (+) Transcript_3362:4018-4983(+)